MSVKKSLKVPPPPVYAEKEANRVIPILISALFIIALFIGASVLYRTAVVGKAIEVAPKEPFDLDLKSTEQFNFNINKWDVVFTPSLKVARWNVSVAVTPKQSGLVEYVIRDEKTVLALGLLDKSLAEPVQLYLDDDDVADLAVSVTGGYLKITNLIFGGSEGVTALDHSFKPVVVLSVKKNQSLTYYFNTTLAEVYWVDGNTVKPWDGVTSFELEDKSKLQKWVWTPPHETVLLFYKNNKLVQGFPVAVEDIFYNRQEEKFPSFKLERVSGTTYIASFSFSEGTHPFSLPCGEIDLEKMKDADAIERVYAYEQDVDQWKKGVPSEFSVLKKEKGYVITVKSGKNVTLSTTCTLGVAKVASLPALHKGWNLIGPSGYVPGQSTDLITPAGTKVTEVAVVTKGNKVETLTSPGLLEIGKAYWVNVQ